MDKADSKSGGICTAGRIQRRKRKKIIHSTQELDAQFGKRERKGLFGLFKKK